MNVQPFDQHAYRILDYIENHPHHQNCALAMSGVFTEFGTETLAAILQTLHKRKLLSALFITQPNAISDNLIEQQYTLTNKGLHELQKLTSTAFIHSAQQHHRAMPGTGAFH